MRYRDIPKLLKLVTIVPSDYRSSLEVKIEDPNTPRSHVVVGISAINSQRHPTHLTLCYMTLSANYIMYVHARLKTCLYM